VMRGKIVEQRTGDRSFTYAALIRANQNQSWFSHDRTLIDAQVASFILDFRFYTAARPFGSLIVRPTARRAVLWLFVIC
jgi:hypothetical protein